MNVEKGLIGNALENYKFVYSHYAKHNQVAKSLDILQKMADMRPADIALRLKLADMYAKEGMKSQSSQAYLEAADVHVSKEAFQDAREIFKKVLALDPDNKVVYYKAGVIYFKEGKFNEACKAFKPAFDADPSNQELLELYLESLSKAGRDVDVEEVYKKLLSQDPRRIDLRDKLYRIYLAKQDFDKALAEALAMAAVRVESKEFEAAEELLKGFVAESPRSIDGRRKLSDFYQSIDKPSSAAEELVQAAEVLIEDGDKENAKELLARAVDLAPDHAAARSRLASLQQPVAPKAEPPAVPVAPPEASAAPAATKPSVFEEPPALTEAFAEVEVLIKYGLAAKAIEQLEELAERFPGSPLVHARLRDLYQEGGNTGKAVDHVLALAAIYDREGMSERAEMSLRAALEMFPESTAIRARLGLAPVAAAEAEEKMPPPVFTEELTAEEAPFQSGASVEEAASVFGQGDLDMAGLDADVPPTAGFTEASGGVIELGAPEQAEPFMTEFAPEEALSFKPTPVAQQPVAEPPVAAFTPVEEAPVQEASPVEQQRSRPLRTEYVPGVGRRHEEPKAEPVEDHAAQHEAYEEQPYAEAPAAEEETPFKEEHPEPEAVAEEPLAAGELADIDISEVWAEAEFYYQQGLFNEAKKHYAKIIQLNPSDMRAIARLSEISREAEESQEFTKLAEAVEDLEEFMPSGSLDGELASSESDEEAVRTLMQEIQTLHKPVQPKGRPIVVPPPEKTQKPAPLREASQPKPAAPAPLQEQFMKQAQPKNDRYVPPVPQKAPVPPAASADEDYFDLGEELSKMSMPAAAPTQPPPTDDFFDLAAELKDELGTVSVSSQPTAAAEDQTLDDIFEDFKKGVEAQEGKHDADTHYNLGVSYKEMGLLDDAIAEFILTPEGESKFVQSRYLLGLCYMEQGDYQSAITEMHNALNYSMTYNGNTEERIDMHYDLGLAYQGAVDVEAALAEFQEVYNADPEFRDVASKIEELQRGQYVSMDQLKTDIERDISAKFFQEGEKIERQEKSRKSEKVKQ